MESSGPGAAWAVGGAHGRGGTNHSTIPSNLDFNPQTHSDCSQVLFKHFPEPVAQKTKTFSSSELSG